VERCELEIVAKETKVTAKTHVQEPETLKFIGGSESDHWNHGLANDTLQALWLNHSDDQTRDRQFRAAIAGLVGIAPKDELEGMMAAQLMAAHSAAMECYRRAMIPEQTFDGRRENLNQASKLSRTFTELLEALNRHRGRNSHVSWRAPGQLMDFEQVSCVTHYRLRCQWPQAHGGCPTELLRPALGQSILLAHRKTSPAEQT
jgi:hypothetical protein